MFEEHVGDERKRQKEERRQQVSMSHRRVDGGVFLHPLEDGDVVVLKDGESADEESEQEEDTTPVHSASLTTGGMKRMRGWPSAASSSQTGPSPGSFNR
jgi:hypothetical protein